MLISLVYMHLGLRIGEVAHDFQVQVSRHVTDKLGILNSYDTWHGRSHTKGCIQKQPTLNGTIMYFY